MAKRASHSPERSAVRSADSVHSPAERIRDANAMSLTNSVFDRRAVRFGVSVILLGYLFVVLLGPLSNPVGSEFLTRPLARAVAPIHRALFLGHGYRFFGPDPGPSHLIVYRVVDPQGALIEKRFPDRDEIWPRLMYHRWFMLSETLFREHDLTLDDASFAETQAEFTRQIEALRGRGKLAIARRVEAEKQQLLEQHAKARKRIDELVAAVARNLLKSHNGTQIELFVQRRMLPSPAAVLTGQKIDEPQYLSPLRKIGEFRLDEKGEMESVVWAQTPAPPSTHQPAVAPPESSPIQPVAEQQNETNPDGDKPRDPAASQKQSPEGVRQ